MARFLVRNWPPAFVEWSTKGVRDAFYSSPQFPRLLDPTTLGITIGQGVTEGLIGYVGKASEGRYEPFIFERSLSPMEVELSEDMYIITAEVAEEYRKRTEEPPRLTALVVDPSGFQLKPGEKQALSVQGLDQFGDAIEAGEISWEASGGEISSNGVFAAGDEVGSFLVTARAGKVEATASAQIFEGEPPRSKVKQRIIWEGEVPHQKWTNFYMKVLTGLVSVGGLKLTLRLEAEPSGGVTSALVSTVKGALRAVGLDERLDVD